MENTILPEMGRKIHNSYYSCPQAGQAFTFLLDEKSKQKNQGC